MKPTSTAGASERPAFVAAGCAALVALAFAAAYLQVLKILMEQWSTNDTYSFGFLVPFISGYLIWIQRERLKTTPIVPNFLGGGVVVAASFALLMLGRVSAIVAFQELSLILMIAGVVLLVLGSRFLGVLWFPIAYLLLMLPVWEVLTDRLHYRAQLFSAELGEFLLRAVGIPVHRSQTYLHLPNISLEVASVCSGVNFLIAVVAIGVPQAYVFLRGWLPRMALIAFALAIALLSNGVRVATIGVLSYYQFSAQLHGPGHILQGLFVSSFGFVALMAGGNLLARRYGRVRPIVERGRAPQPVAIPASLWKAAVFATAFMAVSVWYKPGYALAAASDHERPVGLGEAWRPAGTTPPRFLSKGADRRQQAQVFVASDGERMELFVAPLLYVNDDGDVTYRSVELPRTGSASEARVAADGSVVRVNQALFKDDDGQEMRVVFWYAIDGWMTTERTTAKAYAVMRLLTHGRPLPRLVVAVTQSAPGDDNRSQAAHRFVNDVSLALRANDHSAAAAGE